MRNFPLVSVIIPCYQAEKFIKAAIESVIAQTYENLEIIAIDDGSSDKTLSILKEYGGVITILQHPGGINRGVSLTRKLGIDHARGKYIAFLDADDCFEPDKLAAQVNALEAHRGGVLCHTAISLMCDETTSLDFEGNFNYCDHVDIYEYKNKPTYLTSNGICNSSVAIRADILSKIPYYGSQIFQYEDWLMWTLAAEYGKFIYLPEKYTNYRFHNESATNTVEKNKLKGIYSSIELYTTLIAKSVSNNVRRKSSYLIIENLERLRLEYENSPSETGNPIQKSRTIRVLFLMASIKYYFYNSYFTTKLLKPLIKVFSCLRRNV